VSSLSGSFVISKRILCHLQEDPVNHQEDQLFRIQENPVSTPRRTYVISKRILCYLQEDPVLSPRGSCVISKRILCYRILCYLQEDPVLSPGGSCVTSKRILCHFQEDPVSSSKKLTCADNGLLPISLLFMSNKAWPLKNFF